LLHACNNRRGQLLEGSKSSSKKQQHENKQQQQSSSSSSSQAAAQATKSGRSKSGNSKFRKKSKFKNGTLSESQHLWLFAADACILTAL